MRRALSFPLLLALSLAGGAPARAANPDVRTCTGIAILSVSAHTPRVPGGNEANWVPFHVTLECLAGDMGVPSISFAGRFETYICGAGDLAAPVSNFANGATTIEDRTAVLDLVSGVATITPAVDTLAFATGYGVFVVDSCRIGAAASYPGYLDVRLVDPY